MGIEIITFIYFLENIWVPGEWAETFYERMVQCGWGEEELEDDISKSLSSWEKEHKIEILYDDDDIETLIKEVQGNEL